MSGAVAPSGADDAVVFRGVEKRLGGRSVLCGLDLRIHRGETYTLLGGSGSGKSVTLKHVVGLMQPDAGAVTVFGERVDGRSDEDLVPLRRRIGMVFQSAALFDSLSVYENVAYPLREHREWEEDRVGERVRACLEAVGLPGVEAQLPAELSGGMRKRVGVARALALEPELMLYDEPTTGLDPGNARRIGEVLRDLQLRLGVTSMVVTHDMELCFAVSDRVGLLGGGRIVLEGPAAELRAAEPPELREFLEGRASPERTAPGLSTPAAGGGA